MTGEEFAEQDDNNFLQKDQFEKILSAQTAEWQQPAEKGWNILAQLALMALLYQNSSKEFIEFQA